MKPVARRHPQIMKPGSQIDMLELSYRPLQDLRWESPGFPGLIQVASVPVGECFDHGWKCIVSRDICQWAGAKRRVPSEKSGHIPCPISEPPGIIVRIADNRNIVKIMAAECLAWTVECRLFRRGLDFGQAQADLRATCRSPLHSHVVRGRARPGIEFIMPARDLNRSSRA